MTGNLEEIRMPERSRNQTLAQERIRNQSL